MRHIIAIGGRAFAKRREDPFFERYIVEQTGQRRPKIAFLATATGDAPRYIDYFHATFKRLKCRTTHISLFARTPNLRSVLLKQDAIFIGGGNTKSMLAVWREWGVDKILREAWRKGIVLAGTSAGAICWFEQGVTDSWEKKLMPLTCLGFLKGSCCPHYSGEKDRRPAYRRLIRQKKIRPGIAIDDGAAVHFVVGKIRGVITSEKRAHAYRVTIRGGKMAEEKI